MQNTRKEVGTISGAMFFEKATHTRDRDRKTHAN